MYERFHRVPLAPREAYRRRLLTSGKVGVTFVAVSLAIGMAGYMGFENMGVVDAFLNASMILSGMGPIHNPQTTGGKIFAGIYAIFSGFAVLVMAAVVFAPVIHRTFHKLHIADTDDDPRT
jgi:hypothetical protein